MTLRRLTMPSRRFSGLPLIGVLAIIYVIAGKIGLNLASLHASASPVWPPAGIGLAAILLLGYRAWPAIFVGAFLVNLTTAGDIITSVAIASGNTLEAVAGAWLVISAKNYPIAFICGPIVIWTAFRFTQRETATGIFILSVIAVWGTVRGFGPFVGQSENQSLLTVQSWTAVLAITAMALSAGMAERTRIEEELQQQKSIVEAANRTKDHFLAMLSHELRTPLTPVISALESLETEPTQTEDTKASMAMIRRNIELETQLIDDLLDFTRIARDKMQLRFVPVDAHLAISNVVEICRAEVQSKRLHVHLNLRANTHHVAADTAKFQQISWNLLKNAVQFTPDDGEIAISSSNPSPDVLTITMRDTGIGMEPEVMQRIFDPFEQGNRSFERRFGGLGLGLAISKSLAQAHGGTLTAQSDGRDRGSTFLLSMQTTSPAEGLGSPARAGDETSRQGLRILLVDDHQDTCAALEKLLVRRGHLVAATHNVRSAMEAAARNRFDLLISDIALPDGSGIDLMTQLQAISKMPGIAISGFGNNRDIEKSLEAGFCEHLIKPVKLETLEAAMERAIAAGTVSN